MSFTTPYLNKYGLDYDCFVFFQWKEVDSSQLMDSKLKCVFVMPENGNVSDPAAPSEFPSAPPAVAAPMSVPTSHLQPEPSTTAAAPNTNQNSSVASGKVSVPQVNERR